MIIRAAIALALALLIWSAAHAGQQTVVIEDGGDGPWLVVAALVTGLLGIWAARGRRLRRARKSPAWNIVGLQRFRK